MADEKVFVQSVKIKLKTKSGKLIESKFTGLAMCDPDTWEEIKEIGLGEAMKGVNGLPFIISDPTLIDELITEDSDQHDIIDTIRDELRSNHHSSLKES